MESPPREPRASLSSQTAKSLICSTSSDGTVPRTPARRLLLTWGPDTAARGASQEIEDNPCHLDKRSSIRRSSRLQSLEMNTSDLPDGVDRRAFMMRSALIGAMAVITGCSEGPASTGRSACRSPPATPAPPLSEELHVAPKSEGADPHDSRRILQSRSRALELPHHRTDAHHLRLLSALQQAARRSARQGDRNQGPPLWQPQRDRQGTRHRARALWPASIGKEPATVEPEFLDGLVAKPDQIFPVKLGDKTFDVSLKDVIYDATKGDFKHPTR